MIAHIRSKEALHRIILAAVREALFWYADHRPNVPRTHPDSSRQRNTRRRELGIRQARSLKRRMQRRPWTPYAPYIEPPVWSRYGY